MNQHVYQKIAPGELTLTIFRPKPQLIAPIHPITAIPIPCARAEQIQKCGTTSTVHKKNRPTILYLPFRGHGNCGTTVLPT